MWIVELLKSREELCTHTPKKLIWIYGVEQPDLFKTKEIWTPRQCEFVEGFPEDLMSRLEKTNDRGSLCIFDDVMNKVSSKGYFPLNDSYACRACNDQNSKE